jgi:hypothetical protein
MKLNEHERKVLAVLSASDDDGGGYYGFDGIMQRIRLDRRIIRRACRSLARKGFAEFGKGLWNDEGPAGSGYCATRAGRSALALVTAGRACD